MINCWTPNWEELGLRNLSNLAVLGRNNSLITGINVLTINVAVVTYMLSNSTRKSLPEMEKLLKTQVERILLATYGKVGVFFAYSEWRMLCSFTKTNYDVFRMSY